MAITAKDVKNLRDMTGLSRALSWADPLRYAFEAMLKVGEKVSAVAPGVDGSGPSEA